MLPFTWFLLTTFLLGAGGIRMAGQPQGPIQPAPPAEEAPAKRAFGVLPTNTTANESEKYSPISVKQKFVIGAKDSLDYSLIFLVGGIAGLGQMTDQNPSFGGGVAGYARRFGTTYADQAIGNMMTESVFPSILREDPRYFRRGSGSTGSRMLYAMTRIFVTRTDSGRHQFNFSEMAGNAAAVGISNFYYPDNRNAMGNVTKLGEQLGIDAFSQVLKEFWPDVKHKLFDHGKDKSTSKP